jgi:hypothetical protein
MKTPPFRLFVALLALQAATCLRVPDAMAFGKKRPHPVPSPSPTAPASPLPSPQPPPPPPPVVNPICPEPILAQNEYDIAPRANFSLEQALAYFELPAAAAATQAVLSSSPNRRHVAALDRARVVEPGLSDVDALERVIRAGCILSLADYQRFVMTMMTQTLSRRTLKVTDIPWNGMMDQVWVTFGDLSGLRPTLTTIYPNVVVDKYAANIVPPSALIMKIIPENDGTPQLRIQDVVNDPSMAGRMVFAFAIGIWPSADFLNGKTVLANGSGTPTPGCFQLYDRYHGVNANGSKMWLQEN